MVIHLNGMLSGIIDCEWLRYDVVNFSMHQNYVPIVQSIRVTNKSEEDMYELHIRIHSEPDFAADWSKTIDRMPAGKTLEISPVHIVLSAAYLAELTERLTGSLTLEIRHQDQVLYKEVSPITLLAYDQWGGLASMPEMVAAFVMPNHPVIARMIRNASSYLDQWTGDPSFDAYQSRSPNRVRHQAAAIYSAIQELAPTYCVAPASFEEVGQRIRLPDTIADQRLGNCLDLSLLYAACLEAVGLHPLIIFTEGHAFAGVWLVQDMFPEIVQDDIATLTKRLAHGVHEISIVECTLMCSGRKALYQEAEVAAMANLAEPDKFYGLIDLKRARSSAIRPLPLRVSTPNGWEIIAEQTETPDSERQAPGEVTVLQRPQEVSSITMTKQKQWERKLLDLTLRNTLLNFRMTRAALTVLYPRLSELEDSLADGKEFALLPRPVDWDQTMRSSELFQSISHDQPLSVLLQQEFKLYRLRVGADDKDLYRKVTHLYRSARLSIEENGANTLYLALGLLKWYETPNSETARYAPIVLTPVELVRKSSTSGYILRSRDEDPQMNITLLEMLRQDFGCHIDGLDPLPRDERGIDLAGVFTTIRHAIMHIPRWDVVESAHIGLFSFNKFVMWNDIRSRADDLARNKVVASLMSGRLQWEQSETFLKEDQLDELCPPDQLLLPISADSSQIAAVHAAVQGKSFVLHGPPGTGKSQTITNLIAASLASGKTVLFVAEKMAALSVVQNRLEQIGLGPFCLELHSNKSTKRAVLEQFRRTLETARTASPEDWRKQAERLKLAREELNEYVAALHRRYGFGASLYDAIAQYGLYRLAPDSVRFTPDAIGSMTDDRIALWRELVRQLTVAAKAVGDPKHHPLNDIRRSDYSPAMRTQAGELLAQYEACLTNLRLASREVASWLGMDENAINGQNLATWRELAELLSGMPDPLPAAALRAEDTGTMLQQLSQASVHGRVLQSIRRELLSNYQERVLEMDVQSALAAWRQASLQWFLPKLLKQNRIFKLLKAHAQPTGTLTRDRTEATLTRIEKYQEAKTSLAGLEPQIQAPLGALWQELNTDWNAAEQVTGWIRKFQETVSRLHHEFEQVKQVRQRLASALEQGAPAYRARNQHLLERFLNACEAFKEIELSLAEYLMIDFVTMDRQLGEASSWFDVRESKVQGWRQHLDQLRDWCGWIHQRNQAMETGLDPLISACEEGELKHEEIAPAFERGLWMAIIQYIMDTDKRLATFSGNVFEEKIRSFQELMDRYERLVRLEIISRLSANVPPMQQQAAASSEMGILLRAIKGGGRGLSLRKLFEQIPTLLTRLCPCLLMSPMSVAQYLDPRYAPFDLVVFDEASQLPTSEAVGAMARGHNVIVVGDPKQLPPTSFFTNTSTGEIDYDLTEDLESILDDCLALGMPQEHLLWHYRSRHESLIAFSNLRFYENKLLTFPSPYERNSQVKWHYVDGYYDRGNSKQNRAEAQQVVAEIMRRLRDPELRKLSIGVVTFNSMQQTLIEDLLDQAYREHPELEEVAMKMYEPIFVKNLENVQGDERDVIMFSIGYGPDASGKVTLNFGPLNRDGGWRRLNVAVSRARYEMHVFSSLRSDHLDVTRTRAEGVGALRSFLEYAEKGIAALYVEAQHSDAPVIGIEGQIAEGLQRLGYKTDLHVGASGYRIDLAVVDPANPDQYLLAVLCDGEMYRKGRTARDRELLREQVLRKLGWHIHRVWSIDWLDQPDKELQRIQQVIEAILSGTESDRELEQEPAYSDEVQHAQARAEETDISQEAAEINIQFQQVDRPTTAASRTVYTPVQLGRLAWSGEDFLNPVHRSVVENQIRKVIEGEGPISRQLLLRRILPAWGIARSGTRIDQYVTSVIKRIKPKKTVWDGKEYYWPEHLDPREYPWYRIAENDADRRNAEELPPEEIANAVKDVLFAQGSLSVDELVRETVRLLGYSRTGNALDKMVRLGIQAAIHRGYIEVREDRAIYKPTFQRSI